MTLKRQQEIRKLLQEAEDGLTIDEIAAALNMNQSATLKSDQVSLRRQVRALFGVYVDRWKGPIRGRYAAVFMCISTPENAPHPWREE